jgi:hypothetical protein
MMQLVIGGKVVLRESATEDGRIHKVRIRLSTSEYIELTDTNSDGNLAYVRKLGGDDK